jgi:hypothetical protein
MNRVWMAACVAMATLGVACSGSGGGESTAGSGGSGTGSGSMGGTASAGGGTGGSEEGCSKSTPPALQTGGESCTTLGTVTGQVLDQDGNPPSVTTITVCGDACMYGELNADGTFSMAVNHCYKRSSFYSVPVMIFHGWPEYADVTVKIVPDGETDVQNADAGVITTVATNAMKKYSYAEPVATAFTDDNGFSIDVAECELELPAFQEDVYVGEVALDDFPLGTPPTDLLALYFVAPDNSYFTTPGTIRFPNTTQLAAGTAVELMALGNMGTTTVIEAGTFGVVGTGRVSGDGAHVESVPGQDSGLITLGWLGYRVTP